MIRKLCSVAVSVRCVAGFAAGATAGPGSDVARASVLPTPGSYHGMDHHDRAISFTFHGNQVTHFKVGHHTIGGAHVSGHAWHETCHNGWCFKGHWQTDQHVVGSWRGPSGHWVAWSADMPVQATNYQGDYMGSDHHNVSVRFSRSGNHVLHFKVGDHVFGGATVTHGSWPETCHNGWCFKGHWQDDYHVVGSWRAPGGHWIAWEAHAFAA